MVDVVARIVSEFLSFKDRFTHKSNACHTAFYSLVAIAFGKSFQDRVLIFDVGIIGFRIYVGIIVKHRRYEHNGGVGFKSNNTVVYAETYNANIKNQDSALKALAENYSSAGIECGVASVGLVSESVLERKEFRDYTGNNINHPNDFFCRVYAQTIFKALIGYENLAD